MLTSNTAIVHPVRKPRKVREIYDTCQILYEKVLAASKGFVNQTDRDQADREAKAILDRADGDNQTNRLAMLRLWLDVRDWLSDEAARAAKKAQTLAEYEALVAPVRVEWSNALNAWVEKSRAYGQLAVARKFFSDFVRVERLVKNVKADPEAVKVLVAEIAGITADVQFFVWTDPADDVVAEAKPQKRRVAKSGSASKRHKGGVKKIKGELSSKDKAKNAKILAKSFTRD